MPNYKDITGQRFGALTAIAPTDRRQGTNIIWRFRCDCGKIIERTTSHIPDDAACPKCNPRGSKLRKIEPGTRYGKLTTVECLGKNGKEYVWLLRCDCGNTIQLPVSHFCGGKTKSCGCLRQETCRNNSRFEDLTGKTFGRLIVQRQAGRDKKGQILWASKCFCGREKIVSTSDLHDGKALSCGACGKIKLYCVYKHVFPDGRVYFGATSSAPWQKWVSGSKYQKQKSMKDAIESIGGYKAFLDSCSHFYFTPEKQWVRIDGPVSFFEANLFNEREAKRLKNALVDEYDTMNPESGLNSTNGMASGFVYSDIAKKRQSQTKTGEDNRSDYCVYIHRNRENGKVYVGITCRSPEERWQNGKGYDPKSHFGQAIKKYGWDGFEHDVIESNLTHAAANDLEIKMIAKYDSRNPDKGYNITTGGDGSRGTKHTAETKEKLSNLAKARIEITGIIPYKGRKHKPESLAKMSASHKGKNAGINNPSYGRHKTEEEKKKAAEMNSRPINQYTLDGHFIQQYHSGKDAAAAIGVSPSAISAAVRGKSKTCHGYIWKHAEDD